MPNSPDDAITAVQAGDFPHDMLLLCSLLGAYNPSWAPDGMKRVAEALKQKGVSAGIRSIRVENRHVLGGAYSACCTHPRCPRAMCRAAMGCR